LKNKAYGAKYASYFTLQDINQKPPHTAEFKAGGGLVFLFNIYLK